MTYSTLLLSFVPRPGVEPGRVAPLVFETSASTDSAIWALKAGAKIHIIFVIHAKPYHKNSKKY